MDCFNRSSPKIKSKKINCNFDIVKKLILSNTGFLLIAFCLSFAPVLNAQKIDTIYHINGNILTGDFKKLNYGVMTWKMQGMGTISLETPEINNIKSNKQFEIKLKNGDIYFGSFDTTHFDRKVKILSIQGEELININDIVEVYPIKKSFWLRITGNINLGFNYSKGSDVGSLAFSGNLNYRKRKSAYRLSWNNDNTFQADTLSATNVNVEVGYQRALQNYWSLGMAVSGSQNTQLGYRLRLNFATTGIRDIVYNWWNRYFLAAGMSVQRETPFDDSGDITDLAGLVTTVWKVYKYTDPKIWVDTDLSFLPYITGDWRYRVDFNLNPKVGIVANTLQIGFKFYYSFDSRPPANASSTYDWGINFELTYNLH
jgi:hypothetical protein